MDFSLRPLSRAGYVASLGRRRTVGAVVPVAVMLTVMGATGCGGGKSNRGQVTGAVTVDGAVATGSITFTPEDGTSRRAGGPIEAGKFSVEVPVGVSKVAINVPKTVGQRKLYNTPDSPMQPIMEETLPAKYNNATELTIEVKPGENPQDFDLKTK